MKCRYCGIEMLIDRVEEDRESEKFFYKCPNPACVNFGYKKEDNRPEKEDR